MDTEERLKALEAEFQITKEELRQILMDIRAYIMEVEAPFHPDFNQPLLPGQSEMERGVEPNGN